MSIDFVQKAQFLKAELDVFSHTFAHQTDEAIKAQAHRRLRKALNQVEALAEDPGGLWRYLSEEQRWGWLRLVSYVGIALHELKQLEREKKRQEWNALRLNVPLPSESGVSPTPSFSSLQHR